MWLFGILGDETAEDGCDETGSGCVWAKGKSEEIYFLSSAGSWS